MESEPIEEMRVVDHPGLRVIGLPVSAVWEDLRAEVPHAWEKLFARRAEIENRASDVYLEVSIEKVEDRYLQLVGAEVLGEPAVPPGMNSIWIPAGRYLRHRHVGPLTEIAASFGRMTRWAASEEHGVGDLKLDVGYTRTGSEVGHDLFVLINEA